MYNCCIALSRLFVYSNSRLCTCAVVNNYFRREKLTVTSIDLNSGATILPDKRGCASQQRLSLSRRLFKTSLTANLSLR